MLHIHLMDHHGSPRLVMNQPEPVSDPNVINAWIALFTMLHGKPQSTEVNVKFRTQSGHPATAILSGGECFIHMDKGSDISLFMFARDIIPERDNLYEKL